MARFSAARAPPLLGALPLPLLLLVLLHRSAVLPSGAEAAALGSEQEAEGGFSAQYTLHSQQVTAAAALSACAAEGGMLADIHSLADQATVNNLRQSLGSNARVW